MSKSGRMMFYDVNGKLTKVIEPINEHPEHNADWGKGMPNLPKEGLRNFPQEGSIREEDSIITEANGFKNIRYVKSGGTDNFVK